MSQGDNQGLNVGSQWLRWNPHIHAPGTVLNDQFGPDAWEAYLAALEGATPEIRALGVTDYYSLDTYKRVRAAKAEGRLPNCDLIFPNIEMRLGVGTVKHRWANIHLLVSPEDPDHVGEITRILRGLTFETSDRRFACAPDDLVLLGMKSDPSIIDQGSALREGCTQFKVSFDQLREVFRVEGWARRNIIVALSGAEADGSSGIRDAADKSLRQEIEHFAHAIFASSAAQRDFWLGRRTLSPDEVRERYGALKPCLHGCDAHQITAVAAPDGDRFCWIKGGPAFDTLRQACIDPERRAFIGPEPPINATPSQVIKEVAVSNAPWAKTPELKLNAGLVAIIGARGSGKTALADMIACACDAMPDAPGRASFLVRARDLLGGASVELAWGGGDACGRMLDGSDDHSASRYPRARYLSQQFVEELCSAAGMSDGLIGEIERVVFEAHPLTDRDGAVDFAGMLDKRADRHRQARRREEDAIAKLSDQIGDELEKDKLLPALSAEIEKKKVLINGYSTDRSKLVSKGSEERVARLGALHNAAGVVRGNVRHFANRESALVTLRDDVADLRRNRAPATLRASQQRFAPTGLTEEEWQRFLLDHKGDVDTKLTEALDAATKSSASWRGSPHPINDPDKELISAAAELEQQPLSLLEAEIARLEGKVNVDRQTSERYGAISKRITEEETALQTLRLRLADYEKAKQRSGSLMVERDAAFFRVLEAIEQEQVVLSELYAPLTIRLQQAEGTLHKLSFSVSRTADVEKWAGEGEKMLDRRRGPLRGIGTLKELADADLKQAWETGTIAEIAAATKAFRDTNSRALLEHADTNKADPARFRAWLKRFAQWLYSTDHISIRYSINYSEVDIRKLSPGTRGIVLLLLYLALDDADDRPLIIDQPEENLDPKSIYDELVSLFVKAKAKRQVIMVTHNANLVINTDADQIIIARCGPHLPGDLPPITYESGGLESAHIRKTVCDILEGGERAFKERARRLRVRLER